MINSKKMITVCATALTGLAAFGSIAPMAALADVAQSGDTTVKYTLEVPEAWGLSVPGEISIDKSGDVSGDTGAYGLGKIEIVNADGSERESGPSDSNSEYQISGTPSTTKLGTKEVFFGVWNQGEEVSDWKSPMMYGDGDTLDDYGLIGTSLSSDGKSLFTGVILGVQNKDVGTVKAGDSLKISWTATNTVRK